MKPTNKTSRRRFLENTAAIGAIGAIGASQLISACSSGEKTRAVVLPTILDTAPDGQPLKAGVIGCGGRGTGAAFNFLNAGPNLSITAVADLFQDRVDKFRKKLKEEKDVEIASWDLMPTRNCWKQMWMWSSWPPLPISVRYNSRLVLKPANMYLWRNLWLLILWGHVLLWLPPGRLKQPDFAW